jgi:ankyrin repeat protein
MASCYAGNLKEVKRLVALYPTSIFEADNQGLSALWFAIMEGHINVVETLLEAAGTMGGELSSMFVLQTSRPCCSCLEFALIQKRLDIARLLVKAGGHALVLRQSVEGTCLHKACHFGDINIVREILRMGGDDLVQKTDMEGSTALHIACQRGDVEMAKALIKVGGRALLFKTTLDNCRAGAGRTCLWVACAEGHADVIKELLAAGGEALAGEVGPDGRSCLHVACQHHRNRAVLALLAGGGQTARGLLLRPSAHADDKGANPFHAACLHCSRATVRALLATGKQPLLRSQSLLGVSGVLAACIGACAAGAAPAGRERLGVVEELLGAGGAALLTQRAANGSTCLLVASESGHLELVRLLLAAGGRPQVLVTDDEGITCLHGACRARALPTIEALVRAGGEELMRARARATASRACTAPASPATPRRPARWSARRRRRRRRRAARCCSRRWPTGPRASTSRASTAGWRRCAS